MSRGALVPRSVDLSLGIWGGTGVVDEGEKAEGRERVKWRKLIGRKSRR